MAGIGGINLFTKNPYLGNTGGQIQNAFGGAVKKGPGGKEAMDRMFESLDRTLQKANSVEPSNLEPEHAKMDKTQETGGGGELGGGNDQQKKQGQNLNIMA